MSNKIIFTLITLIPISVSTLGQVNYHSNPFEISFGKGHSLYKDIKSSQELLLLRLSNLSRNFDGLRYETYVNLENIIEEGKITFLIGGLPMLRYDIYLLDREFFIKGGIGLNYISRTVIGRRDRGGHFIFSDMIGVGTQVFRQDYVNIEFTYLFRHISNSGIYKSNEGYNSEYIVISFVF